MLRRNFIRTAVATAALGSGILPRFTTSAWSAPDAQLGHLAAVDPSVDRILVILRMFGGNDGINTIVPYHDDEYYKVRRTEYADLTIPEEATLKISGLDGHGFHPALGSLKTLFDEGKVAIIHGVGYPNMDLSHFRGTDIWLSASDWNTFDKTGWTARFMQQRYPDYPNVLPEAPIVLEFGAISGILQQGHHFPIGHNFEERQLQMSASELVFGGEDEALDLHNTMDACLKQGNHFNKAIAQALDAAPTPLMQYTQDDATGPALSTVARMIRGGLKTQIYVIHGGDFDTHHHQTTQHSVQLSRLFDSVYAFQREMEAAGLQDKVTIVPLSEFGRRVEPTFAGTDHGTAGPMFVIGSQVRGGHFSSPPSLRNLDANNNLLWSIDFRQVYSSILSQWFLSSNEHLEATMFGRTYDQLQLFDVVTHSSHQRPFLDTQSVFPNPASDVATVRHGMQAKTVEASITRSDGMLMSYSTVSSDLGKSTLQLTGIPPGSYMVRIASTTCTSWHALTIIR